MLETLFFANSITALFGFVFAISRPSLKLFFGVSVTLLVIQSVAIGLRDPFMMTDTREYVGLFLETATFGDQIEPLFMLILSTIRVFTEDPQIFLIVFSVAINLVCFSFFYSMLGRKALIAFSFFGATHVYWLIHVQVMRNGLAAALLLLSFSLFLKGKTKKGWLFSASALGIHYSTIGPLLALLAGSKLNNVNLRSILAILIIGAFVAAMIFRVLPEIPAFSPWFLRYEAYSYYAVHEFQSSSLGVQYAFFLIITIGFFLVWGKQEAFNKEVFWGYFSIVILSFVLWDNILFRDRVLLFAQLFEPVLIFLLVRTAIGVKDGSAILLATTVPYSALIIFWWGPNSVLIF